MAGGNRGEATLVDFIYVGKHWHYCGRSYMYVCVFVSECVCLIVCVLDIFFTQDS